MTDARRKTFENRSGDINVYRKKKMHAILKYKGGGETRQRHSQYHRIDR